MASISTPICVGFCGRRGVGKTTAADAAADFLRSLKHNVARASLADLARAVSGILLNHSARRAGFIDANHVVHSLTVTAGQLERVVELVTNERYKSSQHKHLKDAFTNDLMRRCARGGSPNQLVFRDHRDGVTYGWLLCLVDDALRAAFGSAAVDYVLRVNPDAKYVVVDDVCFPGEVDAIQAGRGCVLRVMVDGDTVTDCAEEDGLDVNNGVFNSGEQFGKDVELTVRIYVINKPRFYFL